MADCGEPIDYNGHVHICEREAHDDTRCWCPHLNWPKGLRRVTSDAA